VATWSVHTTTEPAANLLRGFSPKVSIRAEAQTTPQPHIQPPTPRTQKRDIH